MVYLVLGDVAVLVANMFSLVAGAGFFCWAFCRLKRQVRKELIFQQLFSLVAADVMVSASLASLYILTVAPGIVPDNWKNTACHIIFWALRRSRILSVFLESHIAVSQVILICGKGAYMCCLKIGLGIIWVIAIAISMIENFDIPVHYDPTRRNGTDNTRCNYDGEDLITLWCLICSFVICSSCYAIVAVQTNCIASPHSRYWNLAGLYPLSFVVQYMPQIYDYVTASGELAGQFLFYLEDVCQGIGGVLNLTIYAILARRVYRDLRVSDCAQVTSDSSKSFITGSTVCRERTASNDSKQNAYFEPLTVCVQGSTPLSHESDSFA